MAAANTDYFTEVGNPGTATTLSAPGHTTGTPTNSTFNVASTSNWPTTTGAIFAIDTYDVSTGLRVPGTYTEWEGVVASSTSITGATLRYGTDQNYSAGSTTRVYIPVASSYLNRLAQGILLHANQDGSLKTAAVQAALGLGTDALNGWNALGYTPATVTYNGNRSYDLVFNTNDLTSTLSAGMRLRTTRTVAAPTQSTSLNGTTQYYSKTTPAGMTFTDDFTVGAWVKLSSYPATSSTIKSRYNGTSGWALFISSGGQVGLAGYNAGAANFSQVLSYQSIPLNKWVHIVGQLDMSAFTATTTTSYVMIDCVDVPAAVSRGGTSPTALIQAGDLQIGAANSTNFFPGKIAQAFVSSAKITQANVRTLYSQGLTSALITANSIISAYSFDNSITDLNTTNANNLTANGSAVATNADSPFGQQASGSISSTLDYAIIQKATFSTNTTVTVQVPEGCTIPTSGGVSAVVYSSQGKPYGMPTQRSKWRLSSLWRTQAGVASNVNFAAFPGWQLVIPGGSWDVGWAAGLYTLTTTPVYWTLSGTNQTGLALGASDLTLQAEVVASAAGTTVPQHYLRDNADLSTATTYAMYTQGATTSAGIVGQNTKCEIFAENAFL